LEWVTAWVSALEMASATAWVMAQEPVMARAQVLEQEMPVSAQETTLEQTLETSRLPAPKQPAGPR